MMPNMRVSQDTVAGAIVVAVGAAVLVVLSRIPTAKFQGIGAALFPQVCASALILGGLALLLRGFVRRGEMIMWPPLRGTALVLLSVVAFGIIAPRFGYAIAGFITIIISGFATTEARPVQLVVFACGMIAFCILLFTAILKVPMPAIVLFSFRF
jgi:putative tricarboxylic transport membrane protein